MDESRIKITLHKHNATISKSAVVEALNIAKGMVDVEAFELKSTKEAMFNNLHVIRVDNQLTCILCNGDKRPQAVLNVNEDATMLESATVNDDNYFAVNVPIAEAIPGILLELALVAGYLKRTSDNKDEF